MAPPSLPALATSMVALAFAYFTSIATTPAAAADREQRDQARALRMTADWLATYPSRLWIGADLPGRCAALDDGRRVCPVSIAVRAWTGGELAPWRCKARVVLPAPRDDDPVRRSSARCHQFDR